MYETPEPERTRPRVSPHVLLAASGVAVSTIFAAIASLAGASPDAAPANQLPREDVVSRSTLTTVPRTSSSSSVSPTTTAESTTTTTETTKSSSTVDTPMGTATRTETTKTTK